MLSNLPYSKFYSVASVDAPQAPIAVGNHEDLDYLADLLHDNQLVLYQGVSNEECYLLFKISYEELVSIVETSRENKKNDTTKNQESN